MDITSFYVSNEKSKLQLEAVKALIQQTYWANNRSEATIIKSIENAICYGVYYNDIQVGFGRVVTDYSTVYWICDIIIDENFRGLGLGKLLMSSIMGNKELEGLLGILSTKNAHGLYEKSGFQKETFKMMTKPRQE